MTVTELKEQRRHLQFRYDNAAWQSGPDYRARIAAIDAQIRDKTAALHDAANDAPFEYERAISEGETA